MKELKLNTPSQLPLPDSDVWYYPNFLSTEKADDFFTHLKKYTPWQQDDIKVYGKIYPQPRLTALYSTNAQAYSYSSIEMKPHNFTSKLLAIKSKVETKSDTVFTTCLLNLYRNGKDSNGWHADDEKSLGVNPVIASITLGQPRYFHFKHRKENSLTYKMLLQHGSLLLMQGATQHHWLHQIPKTAKPIGERINLTFRVVKSE